MKILVVSGSNKTKTPSLNNALVELVKKSNSTEVKIEEVDIKALPFYSQDYDDSYPPFAVELKKQLNDADATILVTPEYNRSVPPVLSNFIAWTSRPFPDNVWQDKPVLTMGATGGLIGTFAAQAHLRQILAHVEAYILPTSVMVGFSEEKMTDGKFTDPKTVQIVENAIKKLISFTEKLKA